MKGSPRQKKQEGSLSGAAVLLDRLNHVRKRKRAFGGQTVDMESIRRQIAREREEKRGR